MSKPSRLPNKDEQDEILNAIDCAGQYGRAWISPITGEEVWIPSAADRTHVWMLFLGEAESRWPKQLRDSGEAGAISKDEPVDVEQASKDAEALRSTVRERFPVVDWDDLFATEDDGVEWILEPLLPARRMIALYSAPKVGKSLLCLEIAVGVSRGGYVLGTHVETPRRVLYVDFENDLRGDIKGRLVAMGFGPSDLGNLAYMSLPSMAKMDTVQGGKELLAAALEYGAEVVMIDTLSRAVQGEENNNDTWLNFYRHTGLLFKQHGIACIRLDHSGKDDAKGMRGGSAKSGDVDAVWRLSTVVDEQTYKLECTDNRFPVAEKTLTLHREQEPLRHRVDSEGDFGAYKAEIDNLIKAMDEAEVPLDYGRDRVKAMLPTDLKASNSRLASAIKRRKELRGQPDLIEAAGG